MLVISVRDKPMKMGKKLMAFRPPFGLNNEYGGNFKGSCPPVNWGSKGASPPTQFVVSVTPPTRSGGYLGISLAVEPEIVGVAGANMQWGHFVCPSSSEKRESTAFDLILRSAWGLSSPGKQVGRSSTPCLKRSQVWGSESERWPKYMQ